MLLETESAFNDPWRVCVWESFHTKEALGREINENLSGHVSLLGMSVVNILPFLYIILFECHLYCQCTS